MGSVQHPCQLSLARLRQDSNDLLGRAAEQQLKHYGGIPQLAAFEELRGAYVYLLSDAASYTTGIDIPVNGVIGIC